VLIVPIIHVRFLEFWSKKISKYKHYRKQLEFISKNGYDEVLKMADERKGPRGKLESS